jgi:hypothetical protein
MVKRVLRKFQLLFFLFIVANKALCLQIEKNFYEQYKYDELQFRIIDKKLLNNDSKFHLIIAGDSNTFGDGNKDEDTLPALLSPIYKNYYIYNWGLRGGGPHDSLYFIEFKNSLAKIKEENGIMLYNFFPFLYERVIGSKNYLKWCKRISPYYALNESDIPVYRGTFQDRYWITGFYQLLNNVKLLDYLIPKFPQIHKRHINLTAQIFNKMKTIYLKKFPHGKFIVIVNNSYSNDPIHIWENEQLIKNLENINVDYVVFNNIPNFKVKYTFKDGHINSRGQRIQAELLIEKLKNKIITKKI